MNRTKEEFMNGYTVFSCGECNFEKEISGVYRIEHKLCPTKEEEAVTLSLPERNITCPKCAAPKAFYYQMQTRSADEPMTIFNTCTTCKYVWKE